MRQPPVGVGSVATPPAPLIRTRAASARWYGSRRVGPPTQTIYDRFSPTAEEHVAAGERHLPVTRAGFCPTTCPTNRAKCRRQGSSSAYIVAGQTVASRVMSSGSRG